MEPFEFKDFTLDEDVHFVGELEGEDKWPKDTMGNKYVNASASNSEAYYLAYAGTWYKFPYNNYTTENWYTSSSVKCACCDGDNIYFIDGNSKLQCLNSKTKECEELGTMPSGYVNYPFITIFDKTIYFGKSGQMDTLDCFDLDTKTFFTLAGPGKYAKTSVSKCNVLPIWNGKIFFHNMVRASGYSDYAMYLYDIKAGTWTTYSPMAAEVNEMRVIGNDMYCIMGGTSAKFYHINLLDNSKTVITLPFAIDAYDKLFNINNQLVYWSASQRRTYTFAPNTSSYPEDTVVLVQGEYKKTNYHTSLYSVPNIVGGNLKWGFYDVFPYIDGSFNRSVPAYYGDGEKWIKFKN